MDGATAVEQFRDDLTSRRRASSLFDGGGEMGELMRSIDWANTPVGPVESWPQSLKTALSVLLKQRTAVFIFWGREHVQFYNDAYRPILGTKKHPAALGQRGSECWPEIWDIILPMLEAVHRGESTAVEDGLLVIDRDGYLEEGYYTYTYSPDRSGIGCRRRCVLRGLQHHRLGHRRTPATYFARPGQPGDCQRCRGRMPVGSRHAFGKSSRRSVRFHFSVR